METMKVEFSLNISLRDYFASGQAKKVSVPRRCEHEVACARSGLFQCSGFLDHLCVPRRPACLADANPHRSRRAISNFRAPASPRV